ncbi:MAG: acyl-CoA dehydrogenase family protein [Frankiaceae bacterium]|nr:acyl-CoA dehydrogenase family protein [Frankiaceae bacterium]MBV9369736.1 acyl-CoA dehydrogenase family protein [Frankiales bacterium]
MTDQGEQLRSFLDGRWAWVRDEVRDTLRDPLFAPVYDISIDEHRERVLEQARRIATTRGPRLLFSKDVGGEQEVGAAITAFETQAFGDLSLLVKGGVQWGLFGGAIQHLGTAEHHRRYLPDVMSLDLLGCFAMTETGHGSDVQSIRTTATYDVETQEFVVHTPDDDARKDYIGNAAQHGRMAVVFAQLHTGGESHGVHALLVPIRDDSCNPCPGVSIEDCGPKAGLNGVDNGRLAFNHVRVPRTALLDRYGSVAEDGTYSSPIENESRRFFTMLGTLVQGRISVSGAAVSGAKVALTIATKYALARRQFKAPGSDDEVVILDFLQHQRRLLPAIASTYALHFAQEELIARAHDVLDGSTVSGGEEDDLARRKLETLAAGIKATTTWHATHTIQTCREACGGAGYLSVNRLPQLKADTDVFTTFEGDNTVLLQLVAKTLLTRYQAEFGDLDTIGTMRFVADQVMETVIERTAARNIVQRLLDAVPGRDEDVDLRDRGYQLSLFEWRERHMLDGLVRRLRKGITDGGDAFEVFNASQDHVLAVARAHIDRIVLEAFVSAIDRCEDPELSKVLDLVCDLHALSHLERDRAWFLEHSRLTPARGKAVTAAVNTVCGELRPYAEMLVEAFGIPDIVLSAPIALGDEAARQAAKRREPSATVQA